MLFVTAGFCIAIAVLEALGFTSDVPWLSGKIEIITLLLLSGAVLYLITAQTNTADSLRQIKHELSVGTDVRTFETDEEAVLFLSTLLMAARKTVDQVVIHDATNEVSENTLKQYSQCQQSFLKRKGVKFRVVMNPEHTERQKRLRELVETYGGLKFHLAFLRDSKESAPALNFTIFDNEAIFIRNPNPSDLVGNFVYVKQPDLVKVYSAYFARIWERAPDAHAMDRMESGDVAILHSVDTGA